MTDYKAAYLKAKELCYFLDEHLEDDLSPDNWKKRLSLYNELHQLEAEIEKEEKEKRGNCYLCNGFGYTAEHDPTDPHEGGNCGESCPIQVQCEKCEGTGII